MTDTSLLRVYLVCFDKEEIKIRRASSFVDFINCFLKRRMVSRSVHKHLVIV